MNLISISPLVLQKLIWIPTRLFLVVFGRLHVRGLENLDNVGANAIFACNHTSELDPILIPASLPFWSRFSPIFYTSREERFYANSGWRQRFYGGSFFKAWGAYPVLVGVHNYELSLTHHISIIKAGGSMCVFPEGSITKTGAIGQGKGGVAYLAYATGVPIIPVRLDGAWRVSIKDLLLRKRRLMVSFGEPMFVSQTTGNSFSLDDFKLYGNYVMERIRLMGAEPVPTLVPKPEPAPIKAN